MHAGERIVVKGEGDESVRFSLLSPPPPFPLEGSPLGVLPDLTPDLQPDSSAPGDLYIIVRPLPHPTFQLVPPSPASRTADRPAADLHTTLSLTLSESLLGFNRLILVHLDGRGLRASQPSPGEKGWRVLQSGDEVVIPQEGMPSRYGVSGDLKCTIEVEMPTEEWAMGIAERGGVDNLRGLLPPRRPDLGPQAVGEGKETDTVELLEPQDHQDDDEEDYSWVRSLPLSRARTPPRSTVH